MVFPILFSVLLHLHPSFSSTQRHLTMTLIIIIIIIICFLTFSFVTPSFVDNFLTILAALQPLTPLTLPSCFFLHLLRVGLLASSCSRSYLPPSRRASTFSSIGSCACFKPCYCYFPRDGTNSGTNCSQRARCDSSQRYSWARRAAGPTLDSYHYFLDF